MNKFEKSMPVRSTDTLHINHFRFARESRFGKHTPFFHSFFLLLAV